MRKQLGLVALCLVNVCVPGCVFAQNGFHLQPAITVLGAHDDNLFFSSNNEQAGSFTRVSPAVETGYESATLQILGSYRFDAEYYQKEQSELDSDQARRFAEASIVYTPDARWMLAGDVSYTRTNTPLDLGPAATGVVPGLFNGRAQAERAALRVQTGYRFTDNTNGQLVYTLSDDELLGALKGRTQTLGAEFNTRFSDKTVFDYGVDLRRYQFDNLQTAALPTVDSGRESRTAWLGFEHVLGPRVTVALRGGPRQVVDGEVRPFILARIQGTWANSDLDLAYERNETTLLGEVGRVESETFSATASYRAGTALELRLSPGYTAIKQEALKVEIFRVNLQANYRINNALSLQATFESSHQKAAALLRNPGAVDRNLVTLGFTLTYPRRAGAAIR